nr:MAG TPA: hypothetical protein [Caudoviricetes sp.]
MNRGVLHKADQKKSSDIEIASGLFFFGRQTNGKNFS